MRIDYGIFFTYGAQVIRLPINPEELPESYEANNSEYNVLGLGPITVPRTPKQKEITISSFFPAEISAVVLTGGRFQPPEFYLEFFRAALAEKRILTYTPVRYLEDGTAFDTQDAGFKCLVMAFDVKEKGGETGDFYYDLTIREYRDYSPQVLTVTENSETQVTVAATPTRETPADKIVVGTKVIANGPFYLSAYGDEPHGTANNRTCIVTRLADPARRYPVHIATENGGPLGWTAESALQIV